jgi:ubiquinone/menaquinone biosynthesis C-methylase UbiE
VTIEKEYYEIEGFWANFNNEQANKDRVEVIFSHMPKNMGSILDAGCGSGILVNFLSDMLGKECLLHGLDRSHAALKHVKTNKSSGDLSSMEFSDKQFDLVACLEVIEHLPVPTYNKSLSELCRVANKYVMISVPNNEDVTSSFIECSSCQSKFNPDYHLRSYSKEIMEVLLNDYGYKPVKIFFVGEHRYYKGLTFFVNFIKSIQRLKSNPFSVSIPCPVCSEVLPPSSNPVDDLAGQVNSKAINTSFALTVKKLIKALWPKEKHFAWVVGLYERV